MRCCLPTILLSVLIYACHPNLPINPPQANNPSGPGARVAQEDVGLLMDVTYQDQPLRVTKKGGLYYLSDDVILPNSDVSLEQAVVQPKAATATTLTGVYRKLRINLWPNNEVWYSLKGDDTGLRSLGPKVEKSVANWNDLKTGITFKRYDGVTPDKGILVFDLSTTNTKNITRGLGFPGKDKENLVLQLRQDASGTTILHEMTHVVGIPHEHQRPIRDQSIRIDQQTARSAGISPADFQSQFLNTVDVTIFTDRVVDTFPFDYNSITMYDTPGIIVSLFSQIPVKRSASLTQKDINLVRTIADYDVRISKVIIRNENYPTLTVPVYLQGTGSKVFTLSAGGPDLVFDYDLVTGYYTYMGYRVDYVDLNNGSFSDDILFAKYHGWVSYKPDRSGIYAIVEKFNNPNPFSQTIRDQVDSDGIAGKGPAVLKVSMVQPDAGHGLLTYIKINKQ